MDAVTDGRVKIVPERYAKSYLDWLSEKRDWPIGRQLWWGHRIPVWSKTFRDADFATAMQDTPIAEAELNDILNHDPLGDSHVYMKCDWEHISWDARSVRTKAMPRCSPASIAAATRIEEMLEAAGFDQESDVLDTWFSSALWPHSTLGWPDETPELKTFYPTSVLITIRDIITLWVARMVLAGPLQHGRSAVPRGVHHPEDSRRLRRDDVEVEGQRRRSARRHRQVRGRRAAVRPGVSHDRDAGRAAAGGVRVPALPGASSRRRRRTASCRGSNARSAASRSARNGPRSRRTRPCRAAPWSASGSSSAATSATSSGTRSRSR